MTASFVSLSLKTGRLIFIWPPSSLWHQPQCKCLEPPDLSDLDDTNEDVDTELLSLSNLTSSDGEWVGGYATHRSHCHWPQLWLHCGIRPWSWWDSWWVCPRFLYVLIGAMESLFQWGLVSTVKPKQQCHWQMRMGTSRTPCFYVFCNGLGYQLLVFP